MEHLMKIPFASIEPQEAEIRLTSQGLLSARNVAHRSTQNFQSTIREANSLLKYANRTDPQASRRSIQTIFKRAYAYHRIGNFANAKLNYEECIRIDNKWALPYYNRACIYHANGNAEGAVKDLNSAIKLNPNNTSFIKSRAMILREMGKYQEALNDYNRMANLQGNRLMKLPTKEEEKPDTVGDLHLWSVLRRDSYDRQSHEIRKAVKAAMQIKYFKSLEKEMIHDLIQKGKLLSYSKDDTLVKQGNLADEFFIILKGNVSIIYENVKDGEVISRVNVKRLYKGDSFGEPSINSVKKARSASVIANIDTKCLIIHHDLYFSILGSHEENVIQKRVDFLGGCRLFTGTFTNREKTLSEVAGLIQIKMYEPGKDILKEGSDVDRLYIIRKGVCQVTIRIPKVYTSVDEKSNDGSWVISNGWQMSNQNIKRSASGENDEGIEEKEGDDNKYESVVVATLAQCQLFGESCVISPSVPSQVTVTSVTMVEIFELSQGSCSALNVQFNPESRAALQESLLFHNPPVEKIMQLRREKFKWDKKKASIVNSVLKHKIMR